jgi:hypothetical protein
MRKYHNTRKGRYQKAEADMARKTAAQRATEVQYANVLGEYFVVHEEKKEQDKEDRRLKRAIETVPDGQWGEYVKTVGNPRIVMDNDAVAERYARLGETVPTKLAYPVIVRKV